MIGWLNAIREWQEEFVGHMSCREFVDTITKDLLGSRVFVFTPRGEVNGNIVPPLHVLANAEVVEIVTYNVSFSQPSYNYFSRISNMDFLF
ncbi:putative relA, TGS domain-containing protein [Helianthus anomalus]